MRAVDLPAALPPLSFSPEGVHAALSTLQRAVEKHVQPVGVWAPFLESRVQRCADSPPTVFLAHPDAFVNDFLRARASPLALRGPGEASVEEAGSAGAVAGAPVAPLPPPLPPWYALAPVLPRLHWDSGAASDGLATLLRRRRRLAAERAEWPDGRPLRDPGRRIAIVTTASLPWLTGTSVNPLLRAAYLARDGQRAVTLLLPWLAPSDQAAVHPSRTFSSPDEQAAFVREWVAERVGFAPDLKLTFYPGRWAPDKRSILPVGDITRYVPDAEADVAVLEEPEHLTWYHHGVRWTDKFAHVVGVVHTNYLEYARREEHGAVKEAVLRFVNSWVVRAYCHSVVKLSDAVQPLPRESTCFVHGVSPRFLAIGEERARRAAAAAATSAPAPTQLGMPVAHSDSLAPVTAAAAASGAEPEPAAAGVRDVRTSFSVSASASSPPAPARVSSDAPRLRRTSSAAAAQRSPRGSVDGPGAGGGGEAQGAIAAAAAAPPQQQQQQQPLAPPAASPDGSSPPPPGTADDGCGVYFIGKVVWGKGYTELLNLVEAHAAASPPSSHPLRVDVFGGGDDLGEVEAAAAAKHLPLTFRGPRDHADPALHAYRVFVNPSLSDVVATTTAEALAMGKWVVVARHPSNAFFESHFRNCLVYDTPEGFSAQLRVALSKEPAPLSASERDALSWEAATERFMDAAAPVGRAGGGGRGKWAEGVADWAAAQLHQTLTGVEPLRGLAGAGPNTAADPPSLADWRPPAWTGGALDRKE